MYFNEIYSILIEETNVDIRDMAARSSKGFKAAHTRKINNIIGLADDDAVERIANDNKIYNKVIRNYDYLIGTKNNDEGVKDIIKMGIKSENKNDSKSEKIARRDIRNKIFGDYKTNNVQQYLYNNVFKKNLGTKSKKVDFTSGINDPGEKSDINIVNIAKNPNLINKLNQESIKSIAEDAFKKAFRFTTKSIDLMSEEKYLIEFPKGAIYVNNNNNENSADYLYKDGKTFHFVEAKLGKANRYMMMEISDFIKSLSELSSFTNEKIIIGKPIILKENSISTLNINDIYITIGGKQKKVRYLNNVDIKKYIKLNDNDNDNLNEIKNIENLLYANEMEKCRKAIGELEYKKESNKEKKYIYNYGSGTKKTNVANTLGANKDKFIFTNLEEMINTLKSKGVKFIKSQATPKEVKYIVDSLNKILGSDVFITKL